MLARGAVKRASSRVTPPRYPIFMTPIQGERAPVNPGAIVKALPEASNVARTMEEKSAVSPGKSSLISATTKGRRKKDIRM